MPIYEVEITNVVVISAKDKTHALDLAYRVRGQIFDDDPKPHINLVCEIKSLGELRQGWDGECVPYGGNGFQRLRELLPA